MRKAKASTFLFFTFGLVLIQGCSTYPGEDPSYWYAGDWYDEWFSVAKIDEQTYAIGEPLYFRKNVSYLIVGEDRAILFDSGPGKHDISWVARSLTTVPITVVFSHTHEDHTGNHDKFQSVALANLPSLSERVTNGRFTPTFLQHGWFDRKEIHITEWWNIGQQLDIGGRTLEVLSVPGHTPESIALFDRERNQIFTGDYLFARGDIFGFSPGADLNEYLATTQTLLTLTDENTMILGAHAGGDPRLDRTALVDLKNGIEGVFDGTGDWSLAWFRPDVYPTPVRRYPAGQLEILTHLFP